MAAAVYLVGDLQTRETVCQKRNQGHGKVEEHAASSPRALVRAGEEHGARVAVWKKSGSTRFNSAWAKAARVVLRRVDGKKGCGARLPRLYRVLTNRPWEDRDWLPDAGGKETGVRHGHAEMKGENTDLWAPSVRERGTGSRPSAT